MLYIIFVVFFCFVEECCCDDGQVNLDQKEALKSFYDSTGGESWNNNTLWGSDEDICDWYGIECTGPLVRSIRLEDNNLLGNFPNEDFFKLLMGLSIIDLSGNELKGKIDGVGVRGDTMSYINLSKNQLSYGIKEGEPFDVLCDLPNLKHLDLEDNKFFNSLPDCFGEYLVYIDLSTNAFIGEIQGSICNINLDDATIKIAHCYLNGTVPDCLCEEEKYMDECNFYGNPDLHCSVSQNLYICCDVNCL